MTYTPTPFRDLVRHAAGLISPAGQIRKTLLAPTDRGCSTKSQSSGCTHAGMAHGHASGALTTRCRQCDIDMISHQHLRKACLSFWRHSHGVFRSAVTTFVLGKTLKIDGGKQPCPTSHSNTLPQLRSSVSSTSCPRSACRSLTQHGHDNTCVPLMDGPYPRVVSAGS